MPAATKVQDSPEALGWLCEGRTYQWIVDEYIRKYGVQTTVSMWAVIRRKHGLSRRIVRDKRLIPWEIGAEHRHSHAIAMLRAEARRRAGMPLSSKVAANLSAWLDRIEREGVVVHYDRATTKGWHYVTRRGGIDLNLIRELGAPCRGDAEGGHQISSEIVIVYEDGRTVPFDPELLSVSSISRS